MLGTIIIPIVKYKHGDITKKNNYRPVPIATITSKIFEILILNICSSSFITLDNQFGFKHKLGTDMCSLVLKSVVDFYNCNSSPVFKCYIDASKEFDHLNFGVLFKKINRKRDECIVCKNFDKHS